MFSNPILGGAGALVRQAIKSPNYVPGTTGWSINADGTAEFSGATVRGAVQATSFTTGTPPAARITIDSSAYNKMNFFQAGTAGPAPDASIQGGRLFAGTVQYASWSTGNANIIMTNTIAGAVPGMSLQAIGGQIDLQANLVTSLGPFTSPAGTAGAPTYSFTGNTNTGLFSTNTNEVAIATAGTAQFYVTGTQIITQLPVAMNNTLTAPGWGTSAAAGIPIHYNAGTGAVFKFTSSARYKRDIAPATDEWAMGLLATRVRSYRPVDPSGPPRHGFIVEELASDMGEAVIRDGKNDPVAVDEAVVLSALVQLVQRVYHTFPELHRRTEN